MSGDSTHRWIVVRIGAVTCLALTIFVGMLLLARHGLATAKRESRASEAAEALAGDATASQANAELQRARVAEYLFDSDPIDMGEYWSLEALEKDRVRRLRSAFADDARVQRAIVHEHAIGLRRRALVNDIFRLAPSGELGEAHDLAMLSETLTEQSLQQTAVVLAAARERARERLTASHAQLRAVRTLLAALAFGGIVLAIALAAFLVRTIGRTFERVRTGEEQFRTLVANVPGAAYRRAAGDAWSMSFVSERIREISGYAASDLMSATPAYASLVPAVERERVCACIAELDPAGDGYFTVDYEIEHADGRPRWVREMGHVVRAAKGEILWLDGTISDISQIKRLEEEGERMEAELRLAQRLEAVGQLAAGVAHEINTPIQFVGDSVRFLDDSFADIQGLLDEYRALLDELSDDPAHRRRIELAEEAADLEYLRERLPAALERTRIGVDRVATIVRAMKGFGRPSQDEHAPADLNEALRSTLIVSSNEYKYVADVETAFDDLPHVVCNVNELNQVFLNLIVNAAHAIGDATRDGRRGTIRIRTTSALDHAIVTISDDGPGIPDDIRTRVFDPFFTTKDVGRGTGQGLAISRSIVVDKHAGSLSVDSRPGEGAEFTIRLPLDRERSG